MAIYLIRHAQSVANINQRTLATHADIELSDMGRQQAQQLANILPQSHRILTSSFKRTLQTAQPILMRDNLQADVFAIEEFSYLSDAKCKNTTLEERMPWVDAYWQRADPEYCDASDAESFSQFYQRVSDFQAYLQSIEQQFLTKNLLVFSHGQFLTLFKMLMLKNHRLSSQLMQDFRNEMQTNPMQNTTFFKYYKDVI